MNQEVLSQLKEVHWPENVSIWPLAVGYYLVLFLLLIIVFWLLNFFVFSKRRRALKKVIHQELSIIETEFMADEDVARLQASVSALLKRVLLAKTKKPKEGLVLDFQTAVFSLFKNPKKTSQMLELLNKDRFHKKPDVDGDFLIKLVREQFKRCRI